MEILKADDWRGFKVGYHHSFHKIDGGGMREGEEQTEFVKMDEPRQCSYSSDTWSNGSKVKETKILEAPPPHNSPSAKPAAEYNGITTRQLRAIMANVNRRCVAEGWKDINGKLLTPDKVTLYDINKYVILPFTVEKQSSFVRALPSTAGPQPPRFFMSHWWGEPVVEFMECLEQAIIDFRVNNQKFLNMRVWVVG